MATAKHAPLRASGTKSYGISELARISGVTVRTLHHYDAIGLLRPSRRGRAGYRVYGDADLRALQRIVVLRELGLSLEAIRGLVEAGTRELRTTLSEHRSRLRSELEQRQAVLRALDAALFEGREETIMEKLFEGTEQFDSIKYQDETRERWGDTESYRESARRTARYGEAEWLQIRAESEALLSAWAALRKGGAAADGLEARSLAERHRQHIDKWYYPCTRAQHAQVSELYVADPRFAATFERYAEGLAGFAAASIRANAAQP